MSDASMSAKQLLLAYLTQIQNPAKAAEVFAEDGILELPTIGVRVQGPAGVEALVGGLLQKVPEFKFGEPTVFIETPDRVFAEYSVQAVVADTGKTYTQTYAGVLIAENGRIKLLREALDTAAAAQAFRKD
ncbi:nuclear transport factor 2 family protein [Roseateles cellulosilyticus]|uniref:Nuclear transport factor 2 family protein n=1 Tax=Pelomonas cellulosilytica TaxID=2906762 RepID=A0ABS8XLC7_9BURK|nr:nuclear transport factor 2 family protein [Pelomonas sp. P8]MCE4553609.1 nuclear transport factor 2 family protein [Pelomonas sp. P8]